MAQEILPPFKNFRINDLRELQRHYNDRGKEKMVKGAVPIGAFPIGLNRINIPLYRMTLGDLEGNYQEIGKQQASKILKDKGENGDTGFSWGKGYADFSVHATRSLTPDLFHDGQWIITDLFEILIDAQGLLSNLQDEGLIEISNIKMKAYAGMVFKRSYRHVHFSNSYVEGLSTDFDKLFLGFMKFFDHSYLDLEEYEFIEKKDSISTQVGGQNTRPYLWAYFRCGRRIDGLRDDRKYRNPGRGKGR